MEAFVITLREGLEIALVIGLVLTYLNRTGRPELRRWVYAGLGLATLASILGAVAFSLAGLNFENEILEGTLLGIAALLVLSLVVWMWRAAHGIKQQVEERLAALTGPGQSRWQGGSLLAFTFFMVVREGIEMLLFLAALSLSGAPDLVSLIGGLAGMALAGLFGVLLVKGSIRINLRRFFRITSFVLLLLVVRLVAGSLHEFSEVGLLPSTPALMSAIGFIVKDSTSTWVLIALVGLPMLGLLPDLRLRPAELAARADEAPAERRKRLARLYRARNWQFGLLGLTLAIILPLGVLMYTTANAEYRPEPQVVTLGHDGMVHIPTGALVTGQLNLYQYEGPQQSVGFMVIKRGENDIAVALNACTICPPKGYHQEEHLLICENCNAPIDTDTVGTPGGCNPIPLDHTVAGGEVQIAAAALDSMQSTFARR